MRTIFVVITTLLFSPTIALAQTLTLYLSVYSAATAPVFVTLYSVPYTPAAIPLMSMNAPYNTHLNKYAVPIINFPSHSFSPFIFQSMDNSTTYNPEIDPALFDDNDGTGYTTNDPNLTKPKTLVYPKTSDISYSMIQQKDGSILLSITNTDKTVNFDAYPSQDLFVIAQDSDSSYAVQGTLSPTCQPYYCGSINASFQHMLPGIYSLQVNNGPEALIFLKNIGKLIAPTVSPVPTSQASAKQRPLPTLSYSRTPTTPTVLGTAISRLEEAPLQSHTRAVSLPVQHKQKSIHHMLPRLNFFQNILQHCSHLLDTICHDIQQYI